MYRGIIPIWSLAIKYLSFDESYKANAKIPFKSFKKLIPFFSYRASITSQSDSVLKL